MADKKQLILVVEGTAALAPYWPTIVSDYLDKLIRSFCDNDSLKSSGTVAELALIMFNSHGSYSSCLVQRSGWTSNVDYFFQWLSAIHFSGGNFCDAATAEGLGEVLMMFHYANESQNQHNLGVQRHCILVAASNPYPLPTPVYRPSIQKIEPSDNCEAQSDSRLSDAEAVAKAFTQCSISLSVVCPRQLPKLKAVYYAAKRNPSSPDPTTDVKNPNYLVLISEAFMEARAALSRPGITSFPSIEIDRTSIPPVLAPPPPLVTSNASLMNPRPISAGTIPPANVKVEPTTVSPMPPAPASVTGTGAGTGTMMLTSGMSQQVQGMQTLGVNYSTAANVDLPQQTTHGGAMQSAQSKYVKIWEGNLSGLKQEQPVFITRLEAYRSATTSAQLAANWPPTMQIVRLISQDHMNNKQYSGKTDFLVFRAMNQHLFLGQLQEKKLCAVIQLPSHTLFLCVSDKAYRLIGMLVPGVCFSYYLPEFSI